MFTNYCERIGISKYILAINRFEIYNLSLVGYPGLHTLFTTLPSPPPASLPPTPPSPSTYPTHSTTIPLHHHPPTPPPPRTSHAGSARLLRGDASGGVHRAAQPLRALSTDCGWVAIFSVFCLVEVLREGMY